MPFLKHKSFVFIQISLKFVPKVPIYNMSAFTQFIRVPRPKDLGPRQLWSRASMLQTSHLSRWVIIIRPAIRRRVTPRPVAISVVPIIIPVATYITRRIPGVMIPASPNIPVPITVSPTIPISTSVSVTAVTVTPPVTITPHISTVAIWTSTFSHFPGIYIWFCKYLLKKQSKLSVMKFKQNPQPPPVSAIIICHH